MTFTLQGAEEMYTKAMDDADEGDYSAQLFVKHCDPFDFVDNNDGKTDDAFRDGFHNDPDKNKFMFLTTVYPRVHPTEEIAAALVLKWTKQYSDDSEMRPVITKANECLNKKDYIGALDVIHNALPVDADALRDIDYAEIHREEKALLKVKRRGRKKQREKNRRLRENRDKASRERKRQLRKNMAEKNEKKKQSKRERKRFSPISKDMRMLDESIKGGFALK